MSEQQQTRPTEDRVERTERGEKGERSGKGGKRGKGGKGGKGYKGGEKGGDKGDKNRPRRPRNFNEDPEMEKEKRTLEELQEEASKVRAEYEEKAAEEGKLRNIDEERNPEEIKALVDERKAVIEEQNTVLNEVKQHLDNKSQEIDRVVAEKNELADKKANVVGQIKKIRQEKNLGRISEQEIKDTIKRLEVEHATRSNLSRKAEQDILKQLKELERAKIDILSLNKHNKVVEELNAQIEKKNEERKDLLNAKNELKEEQKKISTKIQESETQIKNINDGNKAVLGSIQDSKHRLEKQLQAVEHKVKYFEAKKRNAEEWEQYEVNDKKYREEQEKRKREEEEHRLRTDEDYRRRKEMQAKRAEERAKEAEEMEKLNKEDPWWEERALCDTLSAFLEHLLGAKLAQKEKAASKVSEKEKMEEAMRRMNERLGTGGCSQLKKDDDSSFFSVNIKKDSNKKADVAKPAAKASKFGAAKQETVADSQKRSDAISIPFEKFRAFDRLKVDSPKTVAEANRVLDLIKKQRDWIASAESGATMKDYRTGVKEDKKDEGKKSKKPDRK